MESSYPASRLLNPLTELARMIKVFLGAPRARLDQDIEPIPRGARAPIPEQDLRVVQRIEPTLLDAMTVEMVEERDKFLSIIQDPRVTPEQKVGAAIEASRIICKHLRIIKDHNDQNLPEVRDQQFPEDLTLKGMWNEFKCDQPQ